MTSTRSFLRPSILIFSLLAACSHGGSSDSNPAVSGTSIGGNGEAALTGQTAIFEAGRNIGAPRGPQGERADTSLEGKFLSTAANPTAVTRAKAQAKQDLLAKALAHGSCQTKMAPMTRNTQQTSSEGMGQVPEIDATVTGDSCPITFDLKIKKLSAAGSETSAPCSEANGVQTCQYKVSVAMTYVVQDPKVAAQLEVKSGYVKLIIDMKEVLPAAADSQSDPVSFATSGNATVDFKAVDLKDQVFLVSGKLSVDMTETIQPQASPIISGAIKEDLSYLDQAAGTKVSLSGSINLATHQEVYLLNGVPVSAEIYLAEREKLSNSLMKFSASPNNQDNTAAQPAKPIIPEPNQPQATPPPTPLIPTQPANGSHAYACVAAAFNGRDKYIGYGEDKFEAHSMALQTCVKATSNQCSSYVDCQPQEQSPKSYFCQEKNIATGEIFNATGASQLEASYLTQQNCAAAGRAESCAKISESDCVHL